MGVGHWSKWKVFSHGCFKIDFPADFYFSSPREVTVLLVLLQGSNSQSELLNTFSQYDKISQEVVSPFEELRLYF